MTNDLSSLNRDNSFTYDKLCEIASRHQLSPIVLIRRGAEGKAVY